MHKLQIAGLCVMSVLCLATLVQSWPTWTVDKGWYQCCCGEEYDCPETCFTCRNKQVVCNCDACSCFSPGYARERQQPRNPNEFLSMLMRGPSKRYYPY